MYFSTVYRHIRKILCLLQFCSPLFVNRISSDSRASISVANWTTRFSKAHCFLSVYCRRNFLLTALLGNFAVALRAWRRRNFRSSLIFLVVIEFRHCWVCDPKEQYLLSQNHIFLGDTLVRSAFNVLIFLQVLIEIFWKNYYVVQVYLNKII